MPPRRRPRPVSGPAPLEPRLAPSAIVAPPTCPCPDFSRPPAAPAPADAEPGDPPVSNPTVPVGPAVPG